ncbi:MAG: cupin domain-containing protein [Flavobacteriales bacterium]|nr:cupin domain-containing protein [Flavobacteriales bacterium]
MTWTRAAFLLLAFASVCFAFGQRFSSDFAPCGKGPANTVAPLHSDSLCSSFLICVPREVHPHYHDWHTEHVVVIEGEGEMLLGDSVFVIRVGDAIAIPKGTVHAVTTLSGIPLRVVSIQSPRFDGADRVPVER